MTPTISPLSRTKSPLEEEIKLFSPSESDPEGQHSKHHPLPAVPESISPISRSEDYDPTIGAKPYSPFYRHPTPSFKLERIALQTKRSRGSGTSPIDGSTPRPPAWQRLSDEESGSNRRESKLWMQEKRHCDCMQGLSRNQRMLIKAAIAVVILGSMVAIALGITAAVGGGVWKSDHQQETFQG